MTIETETTPVAKIQCPKCGAPTREVAAPFANYKERITEPVPPGPPVDALLDNIRSTYNVGSMFRTADGAGLRRLYLCGLTPTPGNPKIVKTALGAEGIVPWGYNLNGLDVAMSLKKQGMQLWALEGSPQARSLFQAAASASVSGEDGFSETGQDPSILLVVGNELSGVDPGILEICDRVIAIPMQGYKHSLNVAIAFGIAVYYLRFGLRVDTYNGLM